MFKPKHLTSLCSEARQTQHSHASNQVLSEKVVGKSGSLVVILTFLVFQATWWLFTPFQDPTL